MRVACATSDARRGKSCMASVAAAASGGRSAICHTVPAIFSGRAACLPNPCLPFSGGNRPAIQKGRGGASAAGERNANALACKRWDDGALVAQPEKAIASLSCAPAIGDGGYRIDLRGRTKALQPRGEVGDVAASRSSSTCGLRSASVSSDLRTARQILALPSS